MCVVQVADFANRTASGALTTVVSAEVERLRTQHADAVREKSAADSKCRKLADKVAALEGEKADLRRQLEGDQRGPRPGVGCAGGGQAGPGGGQSCQGARRAAAGAAHRPGEPRGAGRGHDARGGRTDAHTAYGWIHIVSWVRGPVTSKCRTESPGFAVWNGCRRSCRNSPLPWGGLCRTPPWSPARGDERALPRRVPALRGLRPG
jgi:hypothetical protein